MALVPWRPLRELGTLEDEMSRLFGSFFGPRLRSTGEEMWAPLADVHEKKDSYIVKADLPEVSPKDVDISVEGRTLSIKGERKSEEETCEGEYCCHERYCGKFQRTITLADEVDAARTKASYKDGVLTITLPKSERTKAKKINVE